MPDHNDINYDALAKAAYVDYRSQVYKDTKVWEDIARAVVAAYVAQQRARGVVEVRAEDLADYLHQRGSSQRRAEVTHRLFEAVDAALANPEDTNG